jgi:hypothetical protein
MNQFAMDSEILVNCYIGCEFSDETYWFARNGNAKNPSQPLFKKKVFRLPLTMQDFKAEILKHVGDCDIVHHKFTNSAGGDVFKNHTILHVQKPQTDRKKLSSKVPVYKHKCDILPETAIFEIGECEQTMDVIVMAVATKSYSTNVRGGSSTTPSSIISTCKAQFIAAQIESLKMSKPLAGCFDRLEFKGTLEQRRKAIVALVNNHCSVDILLADEEIQSTERCTAMLVIERIKFRIQSLSVDYQFPQNCCFRRGDKKVKAWRIAENEEEDEEEIDTTPVQHRAKKSKTEEAKASCACKHATISAGGSFCGLCGGFVDVSMCCGVVVKTPFCTVCGNKKSIWAQILAENSNIYHCDRC